MGIRIRTDQLKPTQYNKMKIFQTIALVSVASGLRTAREAQYAQVSDQVPQVSNQTAQVSDQVPQVSDQVAQVSNQAAQVSDQVPQIDNQAAQNSTQTY